MSQSQLGGEVGSLVTLYTANAFVGEIDRNAQPRLFDEKTLYFIDGPGVSRCRSYVRIVGGRESPLPETVQMFVDGPHSVFPEAVFPFRSGQIVFQHPLP